MAYIFLDESGDLGFDFQHRKTSRFFVVTCLFAQKKRPLEKILRRVHLGLKRKYRKRTGVLHCFRERPITRKRLLRQLANEEVIIMAIYLNKVKVYTHLKNEKTLLYNYVTNILLDRIFKRGAILTSDVSLIASKRETNRFLNQNFRVYLSRQLKNYHQVDLTVEIKAVHEEKCLQVVDFVSWAIFRKYEYNDSSYYNLIKNKIVEENPLFP